MAKVNKPDRLYYADHWFTLSYNKPGAGAIGDDSWGAYQPGGIDIADNMTATQELGVVIHELLHLVIQNSPLRYTLSGADEQVGITEESVCTLVGPAWAQLFRDNPSLIKYLSALAENSRKEHKEILNGGV